ncbi:unnamed protein product [Rodentolepis nana]|uniref:Uncharacterized protein n=1 Tax=Rodentolepis nana TaxID=102285 RepID=A0A0R3TIA1_RODNA|nr:unnamed protein product [Rodentolepis nana]
MIYGKKTDSNGDFQIALLRDRVLNYVYWQICNELFFINTIPQVAALGPQVDVQQEVNLSESCRAHQTVNTDCQLISLANDLHDPILKSLLTCRPGKPLKKHFSDQCEACMRGVCCVPNSSKVTEISRGPRVQLHEPHIRHRRQNPSPNKIDNGGEEESVISEQKVETAASVESEQVEQSMAKLCLNVPTNRTQFGLTGSPDKRGGDDVAFGLLRVGEWLENTTKTRVMKRWKSCGDLVAAYEEMTAKEIH